MVLSDRCVEIESGKGLEKRRLLLSFQAGSVYGGTQGEL